MKTSKTTMIVIAVAFAAALGYYLYTKGDSPADGTVGLLESEGGADVGMAVVNLLNQIQTVNIDTSFFQDPTFMALVDHSVVIPPQPVGRPNPFAPIGGR